MSHTANQRIKLRGKYYAPGDPIELSEDEFEELPEGAASVADELAEDAKERLKEAVATLTDADFKKDGTIRADSLKTLNDLTGLEVTAELVAECLAAGE